MTTQVIERTRCVVDASRFAAMVGVAVGDLTESCLRVLADNDLGYEVLTGAERDGHLLQALRESEVADLRISGPHRAADWERGWGENLREFEAAGHEPGALVPKYNRHRVLRLGGDYVRVANPRFEYDVYTALRHHHFPRWFGKVKRVVEFGCGTGTSLLVLAELFPDMQLCGLDWAESSQQILARLSARIGRTIEGQRFDMFAPDEAIELGAGTGVLTSAALEQIGADHGPLLDFVMARSPDICVHFEPLLELYEGASLFDEVARRYHVRRNYLRGFVPRLQELEAQGKVEILELRRTSFGSYFHEGYSVIVWRPVRSTRGGR
jgi:SAM-dependent methyltransferase